MEVELEVKHAKNPVPIKSKRMSHKVACVLIQSVLLVQLLHGGPLWVDVLPGLGVGLVEVLDEDEEVLEPTLLEQTHQVGRQRFFLVGRDLKLQDLQEVVKKDFSVKIALTLKVAWFEFGCCSPC